MDAREMAYDPFDQFDENTMTGVFSADGDNPIHIRCHYEVCPLCNGKGSHVNPSIDANGIPSGVFAEDPDFEESYFAGHYDVPCAQCGGRRVVPLPNEDDPNAELYQEAIDDHHQYLAEVEAERRMGA